MESVAAMSRVITETKSVVDGIGDGQWDLPTPCTEWTVRDLVNHLTGGATMFATAVEEGSVSDELVGELMGSDILGDDPKGAFRAAADRADAAFREADNLDMIVKLPFGEMPASVALNIAIFDVAVHAVDVAKATGQPDVVDTDVLASALEVGKLMIGPEMRVPGVFGPEVAVDDRASMEDRLAAFAGRAI
jgi:uncharacterized protein (TIGR03086 family)